MWPDGFWTPNYWTPNYYPADASSALIGYWPQAYWTPNYWTRQHFTDTAIAPPAPSAVANDIIYTTTGHRLGGGGRSII